MTKRRVVKNIISAAFYVIAIAYIVVAFFSALGDDIWYDETFSMVFSTRSFKDIVELTAQDVHPPFYYFYLKVMIALIKLITPAGCVSPIACAKIASLVPFVGMIILSITLVRKYFGFLTSGIFVLLITIMPQLMTYGTEIRMYSLAMLLVTVAFLGGVSRRYVVLFVAGILTAYTQYYACIAIIAVYLLGDGSPVLRSVPLSCRENRPRGTTDASDTSCRENRPHGTSVAGDMSREPSPRLNMHPRLKWLICVIASIICYIPWIPKLLKQMGAVTNSYWIQPMTLRSIPGCAKYIFLPVSGDGNINYVCAALTIAACIIIATLFIRLRPLRHEILIALSGIITIGLVIATGFIFSLMGHPIFVYRYMIPAMGVFYLSIAYMFGYVLDREHGLGLVVSIACIIPFLMTGYHNYGGYRYEEYNKLSHIGETMGALKDISDDAVIITNFDQVTALMYYYLPGHEIYLYEGEVDPIVRLTFNRDGEYISESDTVKLITQSLDEGREVIFIGSFNSRDDIIEDWNKDKINATELASVLLERYWFNIYDLSKGAD